MLTDCKTCTVKTYLEWLQDSEHSKDCRLCNKPRSSVTDRDDVHIRLPCCLEVVCWKCLNEYAGSFPAHTAPAGFTCPNPICKRRIIPQPNAGGPVVEAARTLLSTVHWSGLAKTTLPPVMSAHLANTMAAPPPGSDLFLSSGAGLPTAPTDHFADGFNGFATRNSFLLPPPSKQNAPLPAPEPQEMAATIVPQGSNMAAGTMISRKTTVLPDVVSVAVDVDDSEHKYAKRPVTERLARAVNNQIGHGAIEAGDDGMSDLKRMALIALVVIIAVVSLLEAFSRAKPAAVQT